MMPGRDTTEVWWPIIKEINCNSICPNPFLPCHTSLTRPLLVTGLRSLPPCMIWIDPVKNSLKSTIKMIYSLILVAIDSKSDLWLEREENPPLTWNSGKGSGVDREAWLAGKKSYFLSLQLPLLVWGCYNNQGPEGRGLCRSQAT